MFWEQRRPVLHCTQKLTNKINTMNKLQSDPLGSVIGLDVVVQLELQLPALGGRTGSQQISLLELSVLLGGLLARGDQPGAGEHVD